MVVGVVGIAEGQAGRGLAESEYGRWMRVGVLVVGGGVLADRERLFQALLNLVQNAAAATVEGDRIDLAAERRDGSIVFRVRDTGPGIRDADLERIFDRFERGSSMDPSGTGLGLSISRAIVQAHGGRIWATNNSDVGATFHVALPIAPRKETS